MAGTFIFIPPAGSGGQSPFFGDPVANVGALPATGSLGEVRYVIASNGFYAWDGDSWEPVTVLTPIDINSGTTGTLTVSRGGTGVTSVTSNAILYGQGTGNLQEVGPGVRYESLQAGVAGVPTYGAVDLSQAAAVTGTLPVARGGTNSNTALSNGRMMVSAGGQILEGTLTVSGGDIGAVSTLSLSGTGSFLKLSGLTSAQRDALTPQEGMVIYNSEISRFQGYFGGSWGSLHGWGN